MQIQKSNKSKGRVTKNSEEKKNRQVKTARPVIKTLAVSDTARTQPVTQSVYAHTCSRHTVTRANTHAVSQTGRGMQSAGRHVVHIHSATQVLI